MTPPPDAPFASVDEAMDLVRAALGYLARADMASLPTVTQAGLLRELERAESRHTAARARVLAAFDAQRGFTGDGQFGSRSWLYFKTAVTLGAASGAVGWMRRLAARPRVAAALAAGQVSVSYARKICEWSGKLPAGYQAECDEILAGAAAGGAGLEGLSQLAENMFARSAPPDTDAGEDARFKERWFRVTRLFQGRGRPDGDLTPECLAAVTEVLDTLGKKAGPEDDRTADQRRHDALEEAMRLLLASGCLPDRAGQPAQVQLHLTLQDLLGLPGARDAASAAASLTPGSLARLHDTVLRYALSMLSGPAGLAACLRTQLTGGFFPSPSLPLDLGAPTEQVPPHLRRAVTKRDRHCSFPGCTLPPVRCHVHHVIPRSQGGVTRLDNLTLLCSFHHLIVVHRWGWTLHLHADGTTTATSPDGRILHSHGPPDGQDTLWSGPPGYPATAA